MPDATRLSLFFAAAILLAITPGPGIFYVLTRSLKGGRAEGLASSFGTAIGGFGHVLAAAFGLSALLAASATAFALVKYAGATYLIYLGIRTLCQPDTLPHTSQDNLPIHARQTWQALRQGIITELLNPKTALFFLAFIPQFVDPALPLAPQFILLGTLSVCLNTGADVVVAFVAGPIGQWLHNSKRFRRGQRLTTGWALIGLGAYVVVADEGRH
jgi:threonine/homoserine/homoserine lactone efflux protein